MRLNKFIALATGHSRRSADALIRAGKIYVNDVVASVGQTITEHDVVTLNGKPLTRSVKTTIIFHKPTGYVCSRNGQGSKTIYDILPKDYAHLKPVGRLDKDSSGLLILTNDGNLAHKLAHPSFQKTKVYEVSLDKPLAANDKQQIEQGIMLDDGISKLKLSGQGSNWQVVMSEGRNRQIRRTFANLGYNVTHLHRTQFGQFALGTLAKGAFTSADLN